mmetsp:Transcript_22566/g.25686  ORF Transcript_22566/g.25686 Transcript_22566/m.25686 type:complete len:467 (+) Transcript_22566:41-1441(+)
MRGTTLRYYGKTKFSFLRLLPVVFIASFTFIVQNYLSLRVFFPPSSNDNDDDRITFLINTHNRISNYNINPTNLRPSTTNKKIAFVITITGCDDKNNIELVLDAPAILAESIRKTSLSSLYYHDNYDLLAVVHPNHTRCTRYLPEFGYRVLERELGFDPAALKYPLNVEIERKQCCGSIEYLKLEALTMVQYDVVIQLDTDMMILSPFDRLIDALLTGNTKGLPLVEYPNTGSHTAKSKELQPTTKNSNTITNSNTNHTTTRNYDFIFTRDYVQMRTYLEAHQMPIQGGFLVFRPSLEMYRHLVDVVLPRSNYVVNPKKRGTGGWQGLGYGPYYSGAQIQGFLSYIVGEMIFTQRALELDMCHYNHVSVSPTQKQNDTEICLFRHPQTGICRDCRQTSLSEIQSYHFVGNAKPWLCGKGMGPVYRQWFALRRELEEARGWPLPPPETEFFSKHNAWILQPITAPRL